MDVTPFLEVTLKTEDEMKNDLREPVVEFCQVQMKEEPPGEPSTNGISNMQENNVDESSEDDSSLEECEPPLFVKVEEAEIEDEKAKSKDSMVDESALDLPMDLSKKKEPVIVKRKRQPKEDSDSDYEPPASPPAVEATEARSLPGRRAIHPPSTKKHRCSVCKKAFATPSHLQTHMRTHTGTRPFECPECKTTFTQSNNLRRHLRVHTRERPYKCTECECAFRDSSHLQRHKLLHTGEKPFKCDICGSSFAQSNTLRDHKRLHTGERPFGCKECSETFVRRSHLNVHSQKAHGVSLVKPQTNANSQGTE